MSERKLPLFRDEAEEARWWYEHRAEIGADIVKASKEGRTGPSSAEKRAAKRRELSGEGGVLVETLQNAAK